MSAAHALRYVWASLPEKLPQPAPQRRPIETLAFYRKHTEALLRRYMQLSLEIGRTPSLLGNCVFRGKVSSYRLRTFEDTYIFVHDIEKCLKRLDGFAQDLVSRIALQEYTHAETATLTGQSVRSVIRRYGEAIDTLTEIFLDVDLLTVSPR